MIVVQVNNEYKKCPVCWQETTTEQYQAIRKLKELDLLTAFCALVDADFKVIAETTSDEIESVLYQCASFVFNEEEYFRKIAPPTHVRLGGELVMIPTKLGSLTIMQNLIIRQHMSKDKVCLEELVSIACAVYLQPLVDKGKFDYSRAKELEKEILKMPIEKTFPIGFFYLTKLNNFGRFGLVEWFQRLMKRANYAMRSQKKQAYKGSKSLLTSQSSNSTPQSLANSQV